jgi:ABC-type branched-subunit amino acid transport system substrate-binding protein
MKTLFSRLAPLLLLLALLPACAELPGLAPPDRGYAPADTGESLFQAAEASYRRQAYAQAQQSYAQYLQRFPQGRHAVEARLRDAELLGLKGDWQGSLQRYQAILARQPQPDVALKARYGIGRAYFKLGQHREAAQILDSLTAVGDLPRSLWFSSQSLLAEIALKQNDVPQAFARLRLAAQDLASGDHEWFEDLKGRVVEAASPADLENLAGMYRDSPLAAALLLRLARLEQQAGRSEEARKWLKTLGERYPGSPEAAAATRLLEGDKTTLGCLLPLSGELSNLGFRVQRGMELAAQERPLQLVFKDTQSSPGAAAQLVQTLAQDPQVAAIVGPLSSGVAQAAAEAAQQAGMPLLALSQKSDLTQIGNQIFQALLTPKQQVHALVEGGKGMAIQHFAVLYPDSPYGQTFAKLFQEELAAAGLKPALEESYVSGIREFGPTLASLKQAVEAEVAARPGTAALFIPDDAAAVAAIAGQLPQVTLTGVQVLGTNLLHSPGVTPEQLTALQGVLFPEAFFAGDPHPAVQGFVAAYRQKYGENPDYLAAQGYAVIRLLGDLAKSGGPLSRADLPRKLLSVQATADQPWIRGFTSQREQVTAVYLLTIKDNKFQLATPTR